MFKKIKKLGVLAVAFVLTSCNAPNIMGDLKNAVNDVSASTGQINSSLKIEEYVTQKTTLEEQLKTFQDEKDKMIEEGQITKEEHEEVIKQYDQVLKLDTAIAGVKPEDLKAFYINGSKNNMYSTINVLEFKAIPEELKQFDFASMNAENEETINKEIENLKTSRDFFASQVAPEGTEPAPENSEVPEAPATETPATEAPATEAPATETPVTEAPATETPVTEAPKAETSEAPEASEATTSGAETTTEQEPMKPEDIVKSYDSSIEQAKASRMTLIQKGNYLIIVTGSYNEHLEQINKVLDEKIK